MQTPISRNTFLFVTLCDGDSKELQASTHDFEDILRSRPSASLHFEYLYIPGETHNSSPLKSFYAGLQWLYNGWQSENPTSLETLQQHYEGLAKKYGYPIAVPESEVNALGYKFLFSSKKLEAIPIFKSNTDNNPESANAWDSLGDAYKMNSQLELARQSYEKGCSIGIRTKDLNTSSMCSNLAEVKKQIEQNNGNAK